MRYYKQQKHSVVGKIFLDCLKTQSGEESSSVKMKNSLHQTVFSNTPKSKGFSLQQLELCSPKSLFDCKNTVVEFGEYTVLPCKYLQGYKSLNLIRGTYYQHWLT